MSHIPSPAQYLADGGVPIDCWIDWDPVRGQWRARALPAADAPPFEAWADDRHTAALLVLAKRLGVEPQLRAALAGNGGSPGPSPDDGTRPAERPRFAIVEHVSQHSDVKPALGGLGHTDVRFRPPGAK